MTTEVNVIGLMPCPFCGEEVNIRFLSERSLVLDLAEDATGSDYVFDDYSEQLDENLYGSRAQCTSCFTLGRWGENDTVAKGHWNKRSATLKSIVYRESGKVLFTDKLIDIKQKDTNG